MGLRCVCLKLAEPETLPLRDSQVVNESAEYGLNKRSYNTDIQNTYIGIGVAAVNAVSTCV